MLLQLLNKGKIRKLFCGDYQDVAKYIDFIDLKSLFARINLMCEVAEIKEATAIVGNDLKCGH